MPRRCCARSGSTEVRLLTNNPAKVAGLEAAGIEVVERVAHHMPANPHNADYLATKRKKSGHLISRPKQPPDLIEAVAICGRRARAAVAMPVEAMRAAGEPDHRRA